MSALTHFFFRPPALRRSPWQIVEWWESRRLAFNAAIGATGLVTFVMVHLLAALPPHPAPIPFLPSLAVSGVYGIMANVCYTGGWVSELLIRRSGGSELDPVGPALFRYGFAFSIGLTLFPIALVSLFKLGAIVAAIF